MAKRAKTFRIEEDVLNLMNSDIKKINSQNSIADKEQLSEAIYISNLIIDAHKKLESDIYSMSEDLNDKHPDKENEMSEIMIRLESKLDNIERILISKKESDNKELNSDNTSNNESSLNSDNEPMKISWEDISDEDAFIYTGYKWDFK